MKPKINSCPVEEIREVRGVGERIEEVILDWRKRGIWITADLLKKEFPMQRLETKFDFGSVWERASKGGAALTKSLSLETFFKPRVLEEDRQGVSPGSEGRGESTLGRTLMRAWSGVQRTSGAVMNRLSGSTKKLREGGMEEESEGEGSSLTSEEDPVERREREWDMRRNRGVTSSARKGAEFRRRELSLQDKAEFQPGEGEETTGGRYELMNVASEEKNVITNRDSRRKNELLAGGDAGGSVKVGAEFWCRERARGDEMIGFQPREGVETTGGRYGLNERSMSRSDLEAMVKAHPVRRSQESGRKYRKEAARPRRTKSRSTTYDEWSSSESNEEKFHSSRDSRREKNPMLEAKVGPHPERRPQDIERKYREELRTGHPRRTRNRSPHLDERGSSSLNSDENLKKERGQGSQQALCSSESGRGVLSKTPRFLTFDGSGNFRTFEAKFKDYLIDAELEGSSALRVLGHVLQGRAADFFQREKERLKWKNVDEALKAIKCRYDEKELPASALLRFNSAYQKEDEDVKVWADRVWELAFRALPKAGTEEMESQVVIRFCLGLRNKEAARHVKCQTPLSMESALQHYEVFAYADAEKDEKKNKHVRRIDEEGEGGEINKEEWSHFKSMLKSLEKLLQGNSSEGRQKRNWPSLEKNVRTNGDFPRKIECFNCGEIGHMQKDCTMPRRARRTEREDKEEEAEEVPTQPKEMGSIRPVGRRSEILERLEENH